MADNNNNSDNNVPKKKDKEGKVNADQQENYDLVSSNYVKEPSLSGDFKKGGFNSDSPSMAIANNSSKIKSEEENTDETGVDPKSKEKPKVEDTSGGKVDVPKADVTPNIKSDDKSGAEPVDKSGAELNDKSGAEPVDKSGAEPVDKSGDEPVDKSGAEPVDKSGAEPSDNTGADSNNKTEEGKRQEAAKSLIDQFVEKEKEEIGIKGKKKATVEGEPEKEGNEDKAIQTEGAVDSPTDPNDETSQEDIKKKAKANRKKGGQDESNVEEKQVDENESDLDEQIAAKLEAQNAVKDEATKMGTMVGRSMGYGQRLKIVGADKAKDSAAENSEKKEGDAEAKTGKGASHIEKTPFFPADQMAALAKEQDLTVDSEAYQKLKDEKERGAKQAYQQEEQANAEAIAKEDGKKEYYNFYALAYNQGYNQGIQFKKQERIDQYKKAEAEKEKDPNYKLGKMLAMYAGALAVKGEQEFKLELSATQNYDTTYAVVHTNAVAGKDPDGKVLSENFKTAYLKYYNISYSKANAAKRKGPSHEDRLKDPEFKKGYLDGNTLARNENLDAAKKEQLNKIKQDHFSATGVAKSKSDADYNKQRSGFIYGYNAAHHQQKAEKAAKAKKLMERKKNDPVYSLGQAAGTMKGLIASASSMGEVKKIAGDENAIKAKGLNLKIPVTIVEVLKTDACPKALYVDPDKAKDAKEEEVLTAKKKEQNSFFEEAYTLSTNKAYSKGLKAQETLQYDKYKQTEGYRAAMKIVYTGEEKADEQDEKPIKLKLNWGALVAYAKHKCRYLRDDDATKGALEQHIKKAGAYPSL
jgi:hypothetical protein